MEKKTWEIIIKVIIAALSALIGAGSAAVLM